MVVVITTLKTSQYIDVILVIFDVKTAQMELPNPAQPVTTITTESKTKPRVNANV